MLHYGVLEPMPTADQGQPTPLLTGWKAIAGHLGVDRSTAQRWVKSRGLPVRNLPGVNGKPFADVAELDAWLRSGITLAAPPVIPAPAVEAIAVAATVIAPTPVAPAVDAPEPITPAEPSQPAASVEPATRRYWLRTAIFGGGALCGGVLLSLGKLISRGQRRPAGNRIEGATLVVLADDGSTLWRHTFPWELDQVIYKSIPKVCVFADLDHDGEIETLLPYFPVDRPGDRSLVCLDRHGELRWEFLAGHTVTDNLGRQFQPPYWCNSYEVIPSRKGGVSRIVVSSNHQFSFADQVAVLDGKTGKALSEYWHRGHLYRMVVADIDGDGEAEVLLGGVNDAPEYKQATLVVFDNRRIAGATRNPRGGVYYQGMEPGSEKLAVFFPRSPVSGAAEFNLVVDVRATQYTITVIVAEGIRFESPSLAYEFDHSFAIQNVMPSVQFQEQLARLQGSGDAPRETVEVLAGRLKSQVRVVRYTS